MRKYTLEKDLCLHDVYQGLRFQIYFLPGANVYECSVENPNGLGTWLIAGANLIDFKEAKRKAEQAISSLWQSYYRVAS